MLRIQKALFRKNVWYKLNYAIFYVLSILLPTSLISLIFLLYPAAPLINDIQEINYAKDEYERCNAFTGLWAMDSVLCMDEHVLVPHEWAASHLDCIPESYGYSEPLLIDNYPGGLVEETCDGEPTSTWVLRDPFRVPKRRFLDRTLNYFLHLLDINGINPDVYDARITYTLLDDRETTMEKPEFVQWLEEFADANIKDVYDNPGIPDDTCVVENQPCSKTMNAQNILLALVFSTRVVLSQWCPDRSLNQNEIGTCSQDFNETEDYCFQRVGCPMSSLSNESTLDNPRYLEHQLDDVLSKDIQGPGIGRNKYESSKFHLPYKSQSALISGSENGQKYEGELLNLSFFQKEDDAVETVIFRHVYANYDLENVWNDGRTSPFHHRMQAHYTSVDYNRVFDFVPFQSNSYPDRNLYYMTLYPIMNIYYEDRRVAEQKIMSETKANSEYEFFSNELVIRPEKDQNLVNILIRWFNFSVEGRQWHEGGYKPYNVDCETGGPMQLANSTIIAPICYAMSFNTNLLLKERGKLVSKLAKFFFDPLRFDGNTDDIRSLLTEYEQTTLDDELNIDEMITFLVSWIRVSRDEWSEWREKTILGKLIDQDEFENFIRTDKIYATSHGYFWTVTEPIWDIFFDEHFDRSGYVKIEDDKVAKVKCDPQWMADIQQNFGWHLWNSTKIISVQILHRMLQTMNVDDLNSDFAVPLNKWEAKQQMIVKEVAFPNPLSVINTTALYLYILPVTHLVIYIGALPIMANYIRSFINDRDNHMFHYLSIMRIPPYQYFVSHYGLAILDITITSLMQAAALKAVFTGNFFVIFCGIWITFFSLIPFGLLVSSMLKDTSSAIITSGFIILTLNQFWYLNFTIGENIGSIGNYFMILFVPTFGSSWLVQFIQLASLYTQCEDRVMGSACELNGLDANAARGMYLHGVHYWGCFGLLIIHCILCFMLAHYILLVLPLDGSNALSWNFPFQISYYKSLLQSDIIEVDDSDFAGIVQEERQISHEEEDSKKFLFSNHHQVTNKVLSVNRVSKKFKNAQGGGDFFYAVKDVTFDLFEGEVVVLLGHNGAGKTTLINMLTGQLAIDEGTIQVTGYDVIRDRTKARQFIGYCPQFDVQWEYMTTRNHLHFAAIVKGEIDIDSAVEEVAEVLRLTSKLDFRVKDLSGGQRRRVSIGMALLGESTRLLVLDEPSTGVDPSTRRSLWSCIRRLKKSRGVLITTHFMDECEYLADRTAIMAGGTLKALGTNNEIKTALNLGYTLTLTKDGIKFDDIKTKRLIKDLIPFSKIRNDIALEIAFSIPMTNMAELQSVLEILDETADDMGISNYTVGVASIEDAFLSLGSHEDSVVSEVKDLGYDVFTAYAKYIQSGLWHGILLQIPALFYKRWKYFSTSIREVFIGLFGSSLFFVTIAAALGSLITGDTRPAPVTMSNAEVYTEHAGYNLKGKLRWFLAVSESQLGRTEEEFSDLISCMSEKGLKTIFLGNNDKNQVHDYLITDSFMSHHNNRNHPPHLFGIDLKSYDLSNTTYYSEEPVKFDLYHNSPVYTWSFGIGFTSFTQCLNYINRIDFDVTSSSMEKIVYTNALRHEPVDKSRNQDEESQGRAAMGLFFSMAIFFGTSCWTIPFIVEKNSNSKHLQMLSGVNMVFYWMTHMTSDYAIYFISMWIIYLVQYIVGAYFTDSGGYFTSSLISILLFPIADIPRAYTFSFFIKKPAVSLLLSLLYTQISAVASFFLSDFIYEREWVLDMDLALTIINPAYNLASHLLSISKYTVPECEWSQYCPSLLDMSTSRRPDGFHPFGFYLWTWSCAALIWWSIFISLEYLSTNPFARNNLSRIFSFFQIRALENCNEATVDAVQKEADYIRGKNGQPDDNHLLFLDNLRKVFPGRRRIIGRNIPGKVAVAGLSLAVPSGQCFGFLGVNGAGKTTTVNMLTGALSPESGSLAKLCGLDLSSPKLKLSQVVSHCPQFNGLLENLTGREILWFYASISKVDSQKINDFVSELIDYLGIKEFADRPCGTYSGGNKRKLSVALAFLGEPKVVFLDEPSSGVDPASRRKLWNLILNTTRYSNRCVILTTHSMDECEALCDRLTIMKSGRMMCLGTPSEVKNTVGNKFVVELFVDNDTNIEFIVSAFRQAFAQSKIEEINGNRLRLNISREVGTIASIFKFLIQNCNELKFHSYTVSNCSLEAVFVSINGLLEDENNDLGETSYYSDDGSSLTQYDKT